MGYFYQFELILAGIILLSAMTIGGIRIWLKKRESQSETLPIEKDEPENL
jgi:hypothetical protein